MNAATLLQHRHGICVPEMGAACGEMCHWSRIAVLFQEKDAVPLISQIVSFSYTATLLQCPVSVLCNYIKLNATVPVQNFAG